MHFPRVRFTVRRMMVAVAIVAFALALALGGVRWGVRMLWLSQKYQRLARDHEIAEYDDKGSEVRLRNLAALQGPNNNYERVAARIQRRAEYHGRMRAKYMRAAYRPFLPVAPDPPEPE